MNYFLGPRTYLSPGHFFALKEGTACVGAHPRHCHPERSEGEGTAVVCFYASIRPAARFQSAGSRSYQSQLKSTHAGFIFSISAIFLALVQPFNCFSRSIAFVTSSKPANHTSRSQFYRAVKPSCSLHLCSKTRLSRFPVTPI